MGCDNIDNKDVAWADDIEEGVFLLIDTQPIGMSTEVRQVVVKLIGEYIYTVDCMTAQPKWWNVKIIYSETDMYKVDDEVNICLPYLKDIKYKKISEEEALAKVI